MTKTIAHNEKVEAPTDAEIFTAENPSLTYWRRKAEESDRRALQAQIRNHHSRQLVRFTPVEDAFAELGDYACRVEHVCVALMDAYREALRMMVQKDREIARLHDQQRRQA